MFGQFLVVPDPEPEVEPLEPEPVDEFDEPVPVLPAPVLPVLELDDGVVPEELELLPEFPEFPEFPELPVVVDVVAALATSAPPATRPDVSAPMARTLRSRICMSVALSSVSCTGPFGPVLHTVRFRSVHQRRTT
jgi:hypothetical protein